MHPSKPRHHNEDATTYKPSCNHAISYHFCGSLHANCLVNVYLWLIDRSKNDAETRRVIVALAMTVIASRLWIQNPNYSIAIHSLFGNGREPHAG